MTVYAPLRRQTVGAQPPFEFEKWAVIALGGIPNKTQVGDMGIDGRIFPVAAAPSKTSAAKGKPVGCILMHLLLAVLIHAVLMVH